MTVALAVRTGSAVVFAADSRVSVWSPYLDDEGEDQFRKVIFDGGTKVAHDRSMRLMMVASGGANRAASVCDIVSRHQWQDCRDEAAEHDAITSLVREMQGKWDKTTTSTDMFFATTSSETRLPRMWQASVGEVFGVSPRPQTPGVYVLSHSRYVEALTAGCDRELADALARSGVPPSTLETARINAFVPDAGIAFDAMPPQDAINFASLLATVQIEMERFQRADSPCGGPVDLMVLQALPQPSILFLPGERLHHPYFRTGIANRWHPTAAPVPKKR